MTPFPVCPALPARSQANRLGVFTGPFHLAGDIQIVKAGRAFLGCVQSFRPALADDLVVLLRPSGVKSLGWRDDSPVTVSDDNLRQFAVVPGVFVGITLAVVVPKFANGVPIPPNVFCLNYIRDNPVPAWDILSCHLGISTRRRYPVAVSEITLLNSFGDRSIHTNGFSWGIKSLLNGVKRLISLARRLVPLGLCPIIVWDRAALSDRRQIVVVFTVRRSVIYSVFAVPFVPLLSCLLIDNLLRGLHVPGFQGGKILFIDILVRPSAGGGLVIRLLNAYSVLVPNDEIMGPLASPAAPLVEIPKSGDTDVFQKHRHCFIVIGNLRNCRLTNPKIPIRRDLPHVNPSGHAKQIVNPFYVRGNI